MKLAERILEKYFSLDEKLIQLNKGQKFGQVVIASGGAGCYPKGTEFFNGTEWKPIESYIEGDKVLQVCPKTLKASLVLPEDYQDLPSDLFYRVQNKAVDFTFSAEHKHLMKNDKTQKLEEVETSTILDKHEMNVRGCKKYLVNGFEYSGEGINVDDDMMRMIIAVVADGHLMKSRNVFRIRLKKKRKIERFNQLVAKADVKLTRDVYEENDYNVFEIANTFLSEKKFPSSWFNMNRSQMEVFSDEILRWDGSVYQGDTKYAPTKTFYSTEKSSADLVQFVFASLGVGTHFREDVREGRNTCYEVHLRKTKFKGISKDKREEERKSTDIDIVDRGERMYCFTVPTGFFAVRQNNNIYVSGNSGKGFALGQFVGVPNAKTFDVDALKGKLIKLAKLKGDKEISNLNLKNPDHVAKLHQIVKEKGIADKEIESFLNSANKNRLPNVIFDKTAKDQKDIQKVINQVLDVGYKPENIHLVWVLTNYKVAFKRNIKRDRIVPRDIFLQTHRGAATTMRGVVMDGNVPKNLDGEIHVVLNNQAETENWVDSKGNDVLNTKFNKPTPKSFTSLKIKESGKGIISDSKILDQIADWINNNVPKSVLSESLEMTISF